MRVSEGFLAVRNVRSQLDFERRESANRRCGSIMRNCASPERDFIETPVFDVNAATRRTLDSGFSIAAI